MTGTAVPAPDPVAAVLGDGEVRYSTVWEDYRLLEAGLGDLSGRRLLVITSAGCNVLNLLLHAPRSIVAIDVNPAQNAILELKLAGIRRLDHAGLLRLVGTMPGADRLALYERARGAMSAAARAWWDARTAVIEDGVEQCGRLDRFLAGFRRLHVERIHPPETIARLFAIRGRDARRRFVEEEFCSPAMEEALRSYFTRDAIAGEGRHPVQFRHVKMSDVTAHFIRRFRRACIELAADNFYLERFLLGAPRTVETGPPWQQRGAFDRLRSLVDRVEIVTDRLEEFVARVAPATFTGAALSDVFEYMDADRSDALFATLTGALVPGGRLAYWNLLVPRSAPTAMRDRLRSMTGIARSLSRRDRAWFYEAFHVEEVRA